MPTGTSHHSAKAFVLVAIGTLGLVTTTAIPVLAASFNTTGSMNAARENHSPTLLANGQVLVTGGDNFTDGLLARCW